MACKTSTVAAMKHRVTLQSPTRAPDGQGGYTESWSDEVNLWASVTPLKGYERMQAMRLETPISHKVVIRFRRGVTNAQRLIFKERILNIKEAINVDEADAFLQLLCVEMGA